MDKSNLLEIYHIESMGTLDGPGVRTVIFLQGCPLRCNYCHNADSWLQDKGKMMTFDDLLSMIEKNRPYFGKEGGVTLSGGEPLMQADNLLEFMKILKKNKIHITLDTSGYMLNDTIREVVKMSDLVLLDIKAFDDESYKEISKLSMFKALKFLEFLRQEGIRHWIRHVKLPDRPLKLESLKALAAHHSCDKYEILPYHKMGEEKWQAWQDIYRKHYDIRKQSV